jgi:D-serine dehydratase
MLRERQVPMPAGQLRSALEIWSYVQSVPEAGLALLTLGKRDVGYDYDLPHVAIWFRPGAMSRPEPVSPECKLTALNDQHAYPAVPSESVFMVGDLVAVAISHPCKTFDRWQVVLLVNERLDVTGAVRTFF